jgi:dihydrofolate reductase
MAKVLYHVTMSLDGFIAGPEHSMDWLFGQDFGGGEETRQAARSTGAAIAGRNGYEVGRKAGHELFGGAWSGPIFVLTNNPPTDEINPAYTFVSGDLRPVVASALEAAAGKNVLLLSGVLAAQAIEAGLLDEIRIQLVPVLLGQGIPLFRSTGPTVALEPLASTPAGKTTSLRYRVIS